MLRIEHIDFDGFLDATGVEALTSLIPVGLQHQLQRVLEVPATLIKRFAMRDGAGYFFDPAHEPSSAFGLNDGVVALLHMQEHMTNSMAWRQAKPCQEAHAGEISDQPVYNVIQSQFHVFFRLEPRSEVIE